MSDINKIIIDPNNFLLENNYKNNVFITQKKNTKKTIFRFFSDFDDKNYNQFTRFIDILSGVHENTYEVVKIKLVKALNPLGSSTLTCSKIE